jgi:hypothetical protein
MNAFLVITGILIVGMLITLWVIKKFNIQSKVFGIPLKYVLDVALVLTGTIALIIIKSALGGKSKTIATLLAKLQITGAQNKIDIVDEGIKEKTALIATIDQKIHALPATQQSDVDALVAQQNAVKKDLADLNAQKQDHTDNKTTLEQKIKEMESI